MDERCFGISPRTGKCSCLTEQSPDCGTIKCPFYKPESKKNWKRVEKNGKVTFEPIRCW